MTKNWRDEFDKAVALLRVTDVANAVIKTFITSLIEELERKAEAGSELQKAVKSIKDDGEGEWELQRDDALDAYRQAIK
jgi:6-phosphogluconate dehydrogenase (decarboxylating)